MPLARYGVLAGRVAGRRAEGGTDTPHYQVHVRGGGANHRVAANVLSREHPSELLYLADEAFDHPLVQQLPALPDGFSELPSAAGGLALDFIGANLFDRTLLRPVPATVPGPDNDLADKLWTTSWNGPRPTRPPGCTPSGSAGARSRACPTRCSASRPATASTTST
jgi:uncharacterized protein YukJ